MATGCVACGYLTVDKGFSISGGKPEGTTVGKVWYQWGRPAGTTVDKGVGTSWGRPMGTTEDKGFGVGTSVGEACRYSTTEKAGGLAAERGHQTLMWAN